MSKIRALLRDETGPELVEWVVIAVIALLITVGVLNAILKEGLPQYFDQVMKSLGFDRVW
jgi:Flp pilus assembly pilin Flp